MTIFHQLINNFELIGGNIGYTDCGNYPIKRATVTPGAGDSGLLQVELNRRLTTEQETHIVQRLLTVRGVTQVDTTHVPLDPDEPPAPVEASTGTTSVLREPTAVLANGAVAELVTEADDADDP